MALPEFRRINVEDLHGAGPWIPTLINPLNIFNEGVYNILNKQLVIGQNVSGMTFTATFTTRADYATGGWVPIVFNFTGANAPKSCLLGSIDQTSPAAVILTATSLIWSYNINTAPPQVSVNYVAGLLASKTYQATFLVL
jgi:hypothetical protein